MRTNAIPRVHESVDVLEREAEARPPAVALHGGQVDDVLPGRHEALDAVHPSAPANRLGNTGLHPGLLVEAQEAHTRSLLEIVHPPALEIPARGQGEQTAHLTHGQIDATRLFQQRDDGLERIGMRRGRERIGGVDSWVSGARARENR